MLSLRRESGNLISGSSRCWDFGGENMRVTNVFIRPVRLSNYCNGTPAETEGVWLGRLMDAQWNGKISNLTNDDMFLIWECGIENKERKRRKTAQLHVQIRNKRGIRKPSRPVALFQPGIRINFRNDDSPFLTSYQVPRKARKNFTGPQTCRLHRMRYKER